MDIIQEYLLRTAFFLIQMLVAWVLLFLMFGFLGRLAALWFVNGVFMSCFLGVVCFNLGSFIGLYDKAGAKELFFIWPFIALNTAVVPLFYWLDKQKAKRETATRIPEASLHMMAYIGGAAGALVAQTVLRHKTVKAGFRRKTWLALVFNIVVFYLHLLVYR